MLATLVSPRLIGRPVIWDAEDAGLEVGRFRRHARP